MAKAHRSRRSRSQGLVIEAETTADRSVKILSAQGFFTVCLGKSSLQSIPEPRAHALAVKKVGNEQH